MTDNEEVNGLFDSTRLFDEAKADFEKLRMQLPFAVSKRDKAELCAKCYADLEQMDIYVRNVKRAGLACASDSDEEYLDDAYCEIDGYFSSIKKEGSETAEQSADEDFPYNYGVRKYSELLKYWNDKNGVEDSYCEFSETCGDCCNDVGTLIRKLESAAPDFQKLYYEVKDLQKKRVFGQDRQDYKDIVDEKSGSKEYHMSLQKIIDGLINKADDKSRRVNNDCFEYESICGNKYGFDEAMGLLAEIFLPISENFAATITSAKKEGWVDWRPRKGKMRGNYTNCIYKTGQSMIVTTFKGSAEDVCKLAHELAHAYHGWLLHKVPYFEAEIVLPDSEIFAICCENYVASRIMNEEWAKYRIKKAMRADIASLLTGKEVLQNGEKQNLCDIYYEKFSILADSAENQVVPYYWMFKIYNYFVLQPFYESYYVLGQTLYVLMMWQKKDGGAQFLRSFEAAVTERDRRKFCDAAIGLSEQEQTDIVNTFWRNK